MDAFTRNKTATMRRKLSHLYFPVMVFMAGIIMPIVAPVQVIAQAATITVRGFVTNKQGPMQGVSVNEEGAGNGVATDEKGSFTIQAPANGVLIFTSVGYATHRVNVDNKTSINVVLAIANKALDEVVVVGYGTQRRGNVTGSVGIVSGNDITTAATTGVGQALQGRVSGVQITR
ncbi:MAG: TonB-linked outer membrane protein SusC/RagA family, partial [Segetibacter sp.]|nr:TonB-linked outer membrane protein SusC/RagA family [Segetibacter sp.]